MIRGNSKNPSQKNCKGFEVVLGTPKPDTFAYLILHHKMYYTNPYGTFALIIDKQS